MFVVAHSEDRDRVAAQIPLLPDIAALCVGYMTGPDVIFAVGELKPGGLVDYAIKEDRLDLMIEGFDRGAKHWKWHLHSAVCLGRLHMLQWLYSHGLCGLYDRIVDDAAEKGHLNIVQWLRSEDANPDCLDHSYCLNHDESKTPCFWNATTFANAVRSGNFELVQWMDEHGCPRARDVIGHAARAGNIKLMDWLAKTRRRNRLSPSATTQAAAGGQLEALKWLRDPSTGGGVYPWGDNVCQWAMWGKNLEILKWIRSQAEPSPWPRVWEVCDVSDEIAEWAIANGAPAPYVNSDSDYIPRLDFGSDSE